MLAVASEIGYRPNDLAHSLRRARSRTIGIISNDSFGRFTIPIVEALEERLADAGIAVFMCNATDDPARERQHLDQLLRKRIDGLVVTARRADKRAPIGPFAHGLPVVYVFSQADDPDALCLLPDDKGGAELATAHLAALGRRRIAHVTGPEHFEAVRLRARGLARRPRRRRPARAPRRLPLRPLVGSLGPRRRRPPPRRRRRTRRPLLRQRPDRPRRRRRPPRARPAPSPPTSPSSASTTGR